jgi:hypothetical protein
MIQAGLPIEEQYRWTMSSKIFDGANYALTTGNDVQMKAIN